MPGVGAGAVEHSGCRYRLQKPDDEGMQSFGGGLLDVHLASLSLPRSLTAKHAAAIMSPGRRAGGSMISIRHEVEAATLRIILTRNRADGEELGSVGSLSTE